MKKVWDVIKAIIKYIGITIYYVLECIFVIAAFKFVGILVEPGFANYKNLIATLAIFLAFEIVKRWISWYKIRKLETRVAKLEVMHDDTQIRFTIDNSQTDGR